MAQQNNNHLENGRRTVSTVSCGIVRPDVWYRVDMLIFLLQLFGEPETTAKRSKWEKKIHLLFKGFTS